MHVIKQIVRPLTYIFNGSLITGIFPNDMKTAKVIPVFKSGDRLKFSNYRPISRYTNHLLNNICLNYCRLDSENYLCYKKAIRIIYSLDYHGHTSAFFSLLKNS